MDTTTQDLVTRLLVQSGEHEATASYYMDEGHDDLAKVRLGLAQLLREAADAIAAAPPTDRRILTRCPSCGSQTLFLDDSGHLVCSLIGCKEPVVSRALDAARVNAHELALARAAAGQRGMTDCSTPLPQQIANMAERWDGLSAEPPADLVALVGERLRTQALDVIDRQRAEIDRLKALVAPPLDATRDDAATLKSLEIGVCSSNCGPVYRADADGCCLTCGGDITFHDRSWPLGETRCTVCHDTALPCQLGHTGRLLASASAAPTDPPGLVALVRDIVAWHDARFVQNLGEPFADLIARCRAAAAIADMQRATTPDVQTLVAECRRLATLAGARALEADAAAGERNPPRGWAVHREDAAQYRQMEAAMLAAASALQREHARAERWQAVSDAYEAERQQALVIIATLGIPDTEDQGGHLVPGATRDTLYALRWLAQAHREAHARAEQAERERDEARGLLEPADDPLRRMDIETGKRQLDAMLDASTPRPTTSRLDV